MAHETDGSRWTGTRNQPDILHYCLRVHKTGLQERMELLLFSLMLKCKFLDAPVGLRWTMPLLTVLHDDKRTYIYPEACRTMAGWGLAAVSFAWLSFCLCGSVKLRWQMAGTYCHICYLSEWRAICTLSCRRPRSASSCPSLSVCPLPTATQLEQPTFNIITMLQW